ncbi:secreted RxLR effector protein 161-like [Benincasa hispida]|uniref:secreted RxLR effector protein 161-like n=1 Tax=Benincasa hispida TaxID=102211 RepID=UPI0019022095|nr:secreted RxLR effector protein 161-like [Benincasa hispida]
MIDAKPVSLPIVQHFKFYSLTLLRILTKHTRNRWLSYPNVILISTRPDLSYSASLVSRYMSNPSKRHWEASKWILRYLVWSKNSKLVYQRSAEPKLELYGYVDVDYAGDLDKMRSLTGYLFLFGPNLISWKASLQPIVAISTTEAEYMALTEAIKEALWL